jgi:hypothetical protein
LNQSRVGLEILKQLQNKLEAQHAAKREAQQLEIQDLRQQVEHRSEEIRGLNSTIESLKGVNEELKVSSILRLVLSFDCVFSAHLP